MKRKQIKELPFVSPLGKTASFYVPAAKINDSRYGQGGRRPSELLEEFFVDNFGGFTHEQSQIKGRWVSDNGQMVFTDEHQRYEVSFAGKIKTAEFFAFLSDMCRRLEEGSIYVTYGGDSWLVRPDEPRPGDSAAPADEA